MLLLLFDCLESSEDGGAECPNLFLVFGGWFIQGIDQNELPLRLSPIEGFELLQNLAGTAAATEEGGHGLSLQGGTIVRKKGA